MPSYESVRQLVESAPSATTPGVRDIAWLTDAHVVGVARDPDGRIEVYLVGPELHPATASVRHSIEFRVVHRHELPSFEANRLALPALVHFDQVAAFICTELLRNGADTSLPDAYAKTEPIIELAIERLQLSSHIIVGLVGELLLLDALCRNAADIQVTRVVESWDGWKRSARDFTVGATGVEVKTTTSNVSSHIVEGVHQVERNNVLVNGSVENRLLLLSVGVQVSAGQDGAVSIPRLVDRIVERMESTGSSKPDVDRFLSRLSEYGTDSGGGYEHRAPESDRAYSQGFLTTFFRAYDMADDAVLVLRRQDVAVRAHVDISSVKFRIDLPIAVNVGNPIVGANQVASAVLEALE